MAARLNCRFQAVEVDAVDETGGSAVFVAVDGEGDFGLGWSAFDRISENDESFRD
jgi:hypothetical protein